MITRRDFLKVGAVATLLSLIPFKQLLKAAAVEAEYMGRIYFGTADGEIYVSEDQRQTWNKHFKFGPDQSISKIYASANNALHLEAEYRGYPFSLTLAPNGKDWLVS